MEHYRFQSIVNDNDGVNDDDDDEEEESLIQNIWHFSTITSLPSLVEIPKNRTNVYFAHPQLSFLNVTVGVLQIYTTG